MVLSKARSNKGRGKYPMSSHPCRTSTASSASPLIERNPLLFWKSTTIVLALTVIVLLALLQGMHR